VTVVGLFSGIGGLELAFEQAGFRTSLLVEINPEASAILKVRFPKTRRLGDIAKLKKLPSGTTIVTAGFPCQNLSMAGDKQGIDGTKSGVVSELFRLIEGTRAPVVLLENVYFMLQLDRGRAMNRLASRFEELGYAWAYRVLDTLGFGLPQRRRRVYFVASQELDPREVLFADESLRTSASVQPTLNYPLGFYWTEGRSGVGITVDGIPPLKGGSAIGIPSAPAVLFPDGAALMPDLSGCERLQGFKRGWTSSGTADQSARRAEWRLLGNAVSVPVAAWVASRIATPRSSLQLDSWPLESGDRWPDAAYNNRAGRFAIRASDKPVATAPRSITEFRSRNWKPLSERALHGFITRAVEGGLRFPEGFLNALRRAADHSRAAA
jgi:DNA (cytosine-5)-methyltransferase 1